MKVTPTHIQKQLRSRYCCVVRIQHLILACGWEVIIFIGNLKPIFGFLNPLPTIFKPRLKEESPLFLFCFQQEEMNDLLNSCIFRNADSIAFFNRLGVKDKKKRTKALDEITDCILNWQDGYGSPKDMSESYTSKFQLQDLIPHMVQLSFMCPFDDIRIRCKELLRTLKVSFLLLN